MFICNIMVESVLITGVAGLIGSNFARYLIDNKDVEVIGIDNFSGGQKEFVPDGIIFYQTDLLDYDQVSKIFDQHQINYIYHFAAYAAEGLSPFMRVFNYRTNLLTTTNLINNAIKHKVKRFVFTSSMAVYGRGDPPFDENDDPSPIDPYGISKLACELDLKVAGEQHGLDWCVIRPHNVYGPQQNIWDMYRNVLGIWIYKLLNKEKLTIYSDGTQERAFSYIDDILEPLWNAGISPKASRQIINLGGIHHSQLKDVANILIDIAGYGEVVHLEPRHEVKYAYSTYQKSVDLLGFEHKTNIRDGLTKMWKWAQKEPMRDRIKWINYELTDGLYSYWK